MANINMEYYDGSDYYSDGIIEQEELKYVTQYPSEQYSEIFKTDKRFTVFYDLSHVRRAILEWYPFDKNSNLLEIGGGMGPLTGMFCDKCACVTTVELSRQRAKCIEQRCHDKKNLDIIVGNLNDIQFKKKFDYVVLVGVLEWQGGYTKTSNPYYDFLIKIRSLLSDTGKVLIAIENRMGLKYWCGQCEDHGGLPFGGINNFYYGGKARTFDKKELSLLLENAGFCNQKFYYPLPDYKLPRVIYSEAYLPNRDVLSCMHPYYFNPYSVVALEKMQYQSIIRNGVFEFFANSFLVECSLKSSLPPCNVDFVTISNERNEKYRVITTIMGNGTVQKIAAFSEGINHLKSMDKNTKILKKRGMPILDGKFDKNKIIYKKIDVPVLNDVLYELFMHGQKQEAFELIHEFNIYILMSSDESEHNAIIDMLPLNNDRIEFGPILNTAYCDMTFGNCFYQQGSFLFFDQEWTAEHMPASYVLFHAISEFLYSYPDVKKIVPVDEWKKIFHLDNVWDIYMEIMKSMFVEVQDKAVCDMLGKLRYLPIDTVSNNAKLLLNGQNSFHKLKGFETVIKEKDFQIAGRETIIKEKDFQIAGRETIIKEKDFQIAGREAIIKEKDKQIEVMKQQLNYYNTTTILDKLKLALKIIMSRSN
jgi:hypothetical protein